MESAVVLSVREANVLRQRIYQVTKLRGDLLNGSNPEALHDLRVASRRLRELLDHFEYGLPSKWHNRLMVLTKRLTKTLGSSRETEVNLKMLIDFRTSKKIDPFIAELLINNQKKELSLCQSRAMKRVWQKQFRQYWKFLQVVKGSRTVAPIRSSIVDLRSKEFAELGLGIVLDDQRLHELRIRTKRLRYAVEIETRILQHSQGRLLNRLKKLQDVLGQIHDFFVLHSKVEQIKQEWNDPDLTLVHSGLQEVSDKLTSEKLSLYPRVFPLYSRITVSLPLHETTRSVVELAAAN